ncbi:hypothetical protein KC19_9G124600 [Ceratodon purpureus]|uniref:Chalcone/stilbene synthase C-terminal domain-containing protein n=1 Tax=Ceratodon purpureus TaxID=3225 RepID=A0A8T0GZ46_CERPU|nr:hypothetical protein KC19_9G124600 [Ceratodon purpureus]
MFWAVHPGDPAILDQVEAKLKLSKDKMQGSRDILSENGNMSSSSVLFVLDQMQRVRVRAGPDLGGAGSPRRSHEHVEVNVEPRPWSRHDVCYLLIMQYDLCKL